MAVNNFDACVGFVLQEEGGFSNDRADPGNWTGGKVGKGTLKGTNFGIAASAYPNLDIQHITKQRAINIYKAEYWNCIKGDSLAAGVDLVVFDFAVNSGVDRAAAWLKECGKPNQSPQDLIKAFCAKRMSLLRGLSSWGRFGPGWSARVARCEARALGMAGGKNAINQTIGHAKSLATISKTTATQSGVFGTMGASINHSAGGTHWLTFFVIAGAIIAIAMLAIEAMLQERRVKALEDEAARLAALTPQSQLVKA